MDDRPPTTARAGTVLPVHHALCPSDPRALTEPVGPAAPAARPTATASVRPATRRRLVGIDATRGIGLLLIVAAHVLVYSDPAGAPTPAYVLGGYGAGMFVLVAGIGIGLATGGPTPPAGRRYAEAVVTLAVRAVAITALGLALGYVVDYEKHAVVVLVTFGFLFLFAIPLLRLTARGAAMATVALALVAPVLSLLIWDSLPAPQQVNPTFGVFLGDPLGWIAEVTVRGVYPALAWTALLCAGLAVGRLRRLTSRLVAVALLAGGLAMAAVSQFLSWLALEGLGGRERIESALREIDPETAAQALLWAPGLGDPRPSAWWLAVDNSYSATPLELFGTIGVSFAVLGSLLLLSRLIAPVLRPLATVGAMTLTLYTLHLLVLSLAGLPWAEVSTLLVHLVVLLAFAILWERKRGRGPLESLISFAAKRVTTAVVPPRRTAAPRPPVT